ncbi:GDP-L-fucose synthase [Gillisia sp. M10.2A]|uniref:GDP-L-fucose synthase n=1 Tax=Gillisia lutea TaxID=2909668 RepID=A0ABS9EK26_9FLAO|nr:GDP-L-fucose synthase [Gillisia lutea]MCF4102165.1 GDP-L-fucose synthase [Gillisia lutea]
MQRDSKIYVAGHRGLVGSAILNNLKIKGYTNIVTRTHEELDLISCEEVANFFMEERPEYVFLAAAKVGGIVANNTYRGDFIYQNLMIQTNVIHHSYLNKVKKLLFLGSTCIYPKNCPQPIKEDYLLTGKLEYTNEPYAIAKIAGIRMCESYNLQYATNFIAAMPTNLYGPKDNFDLEKSHVLPALLRKMHLGKALETGNWEDIRSNLSIMPIEGVNANSDKRAILDIFRKYGIEAKNGKVQIEIWGSGRPMREFLWSEEMADACVFLMKEIDFEDIKREINSAEIRDTHINIGTGKDISIKDLAYLIKERVGFEGELFFNTNKADGTLKKVTEISKLQKLGWNSSISLEEGIAKFYVEFLKISSASEIWK